jgi:hypothetical protein
MEDVVEAWYTYIPSDKGALSMREAWHRVFLLFVSLATLACLAMGVNGANVYIDSGRSILKDVSTSTGYIWKGGSCGDLFRAVATSPGSGPSFGAMSELCEIAKKNGLPPVSVRSIIDEQRAARSPGDHSPTGDPGRVRAILWESKKQLLRDLPALTAHFGPYQRQIARMWLFIPALAGGIGIYFYARFFTPVLFASSMRHFNRIMFGKNKYSDMWETFIKPRKRQ